MTSRHGEGNRWIPDLIRDHHVTLRRQLAAALEAAIRDGHLGPGASLPSTRDMAHRLGLHRSTVTAAYARLRRRGCVVGSVGSRMSVASRADARWAADEATPERLASYGVERVLGHAVRSGVSREAALKSLALTANRVAERAEVSRRGVTLFEPRPGLRAVLASELARRLGVPVDPTGHPARAAGRDNPLLVRADLREWVERRRLGGPEVIPLHIAGGTRERGFVRRGARGGLVTLVSVSRTVRYYARDLAVREFGRGISFTTLDPGDTRAMYRVGGVSRLVLFDEPSREHIPQLRAPALAIRLLTETQVVALRTYLGVPMEGPGGSNAGRSTSANGRRRGT